MKSQYLEFRIYSNSIRTAQCIVSYHLTTRTKVIGVFLWVDSVLKMTDVVYENTLVMHMTTKH